MRHANLLTIALLALSPFALAPFAGCGGDDGGGGGSTSSTTTGTGGTGGSAGSDGTGGAGGGTGGGGGTGTGGSTGEPAGHLLISEVSVNPGAAEFIEIWNPTATAVDLTNYYISDNATYYRIANGEAWMPAGTQGSDFLAQFPAGATIAPNAYIVLATHTGFEAQFSQCADFSLITTPIPCGGNSIPSMLAPTNGGLGTLTTGLFTNDQEMIILFEWDGTEGTSLKDVDYLTWGENVSQSERTDKTGKGGYLPDTPREMQRAATPPGMRQSMSRCLADLEPGEILSGGNGIKGHDETSEALDESFTAVEPRTPGKVNACPVK